MLRQIAWKLKAQGEDGSGNGPPSGHS
jgi:hypothetical protein